MNDVMQKIWTWILNRAANKAIGQLAAVLVAHGILRASDQDSWVSKNVEIAVAALTCLGSWAWSWWKQRKNTVKNATALDTAAITGTGATVQVTSVGGQVVSLKPGACPGADIPQGGDRS